MQHCVLLIHLTNFRNDLLLVTLEEFLMCGLAKIYLPPSNQSISPGNLVAYYPGRLDC